MVEGDVEDELCDLEAARNQVGAAGYEFGYRHDVDLLRKRRGYISSDDCGWVCMGLVEGWVFVAPEPEQPRVLQLF